MKEQFSRNLLLTIQYDGTAYHGYQVQQNAITICEVFQDALEKITGDRHDVIGCSRTDAGVHALDYKISLLTNIIIPTSKLVLAMNRVLPNDIVVLDAVEVPIGFHARYDAVSKTYIYKIYNSKTKNPFMFNYSYFYPYDLDIKLIESEIKHFVGTHDFSAFCTNAKNIDNTVRSIYYVGVVKKGEMIEIEITGNGFLHNMVRIMVGTIINAGRGKLKSGEIAEIIKAKNRRIAGKTVPAHGLFLKKVEYSDI